MCLLVKLVWEMWFLCLLLATFCCCLFFLNLERLFRVGIHNSDSDLQRKRLCCETRRNVQTRELTVDFVFITFWLSGHGLSYRGFESPAGLCGCHNIIHCTVAHCLRVLSQGKGILPRLKSLCVCVSYWKTVQTTGRREEGPQ